MQDMSTAPPPVLWPCVCGFGGGGRGIGRHYRLSSCCFLREVIAIQLAQDSYRYQVNGR